MFPLTLHIIEFTDSTVLVTLIGENIEWNIEHKDLVSN